MTDRKKFLLRLIAYLIIGLVFPVVFLVYRFQLFSKITTVSIGGWGFVLIIFIIGFIWKLFSNLRKGMKFSFYKQIINGLCSVTFPLLIAVLSVYWLSGLTTELIEFLIVLLVCESVAIPINPLPQWKFENNMEETAVGIGRIVDIIRNRNSN